MATGDILSATVATNGRWLLLVIEGLNTGGTYNPGWTFTDDPDQLSTPKVKLVVTSMGFLGGVATTVERHPAAGNTGTTAEAQFVNRQSATEVAGVLTAGNGGGDYRIPPTSPLAKRLVRSMLKWDLEGKARCVRDASGAYALRKSAIGRSLAF